MVNIQRAKKKDGHPILLQQEVEQNAQVLLKKEDMSSNAIKIRIRDGKYSTDQKKRWASHSTSIRSRTKCPSTAEKGRYVIKYNQKQN